MNAETQTHVEADALRAAVLQAAMPADANDSQVAVREKSKRNPKVSGRNGQPVPAGRPKGVRNKLTNMRDAVLEAFETVGGAAYLVRLAEGTQSDRAAFVSIINKVLPSQINAQVDGGIKLELSWLGQRNIGASAAQPAEVVTQVIDLEQDKRGKYRIADPKPEPEQGGTKPETPAA